MELIFFRRGTPQPSGVQQQHPQAPQDQAQSCSTPQPPSQRSLTPVAPMDTENQKEEPGDRTGESPSKNTQTVWFFLNILS